jgi:hypothetical protein
VIERGSQYGPTAASHDGPDTGMCRVRHRSVAIARRAWATLCDLELLESALAFAGVASAVTGLFQFVWPTLPATLGSRMALAVLGVSCLVLLIRQSGRQALIAVPRGLGWRIEACVGDIFDEKTRVVTADRTLTSDRETIGSSSLLAQLLDRAGPESSGKYLAALSAGRATSGVHPPGFVLTISDADTTTFVLAVGTSSAAGSVTSWQQLWQSYDGLWHHLRSRNVEYFAMPAIGSGYSGTSLDHNAVIASILTSFHSSSIERVVAPRMRLVIIPSAAGAIRSAGRLLRALGYDVKYRRRPQ